MMRPGTRLRRLAARICGPTTMTRLADPVLADLQVEYELAARNGRTWQRRWILLAGYLAFFKALAWHGGGRLLRAGRGLTGDDRLALKRTFGSSAALLLVGTALLVAPPPDAMPRDHPRAVLLVLCLIPQALRLSIPVALTWGVFWGFSRTAASRRSRALVALVAAAASAASFVLLAWIIPGSNQAFRVAVAEHAVFEGPNELTLAELARVLERAADDPRALPPGLRNPRTLALNYHTRWALAVTPLLLCLLALDVTRRGPRRWLTVSGGCAVVAGYYVCMYVARSLNAAGPVGPAVAAWTPNILVAISLVAGRVARLFRH